ncbi:MAG: TIGR01777 family oxidoreductase [Candidatus Nanopelagicales bacterium]|jgi:uncharacterized protein (TIGR01777 family)|nr:TIGR01777 family oxidoreductase [Candidatus Nanopelagicales bacterium]
MRIAITGASGLIGSELVPHLRASQHEVIRLVRRDPTAADEVRWGPDTGFVGDLGDIDAVVHLAGAGVGDHRWSDSYKKEILDSRVNGTETISRAIAQMEHKPHTLISASAIGFYGDTGTTAVTETDPAGHGFLSDVVVAWENATHAASDAGIRVVHLRTGLVVSARGGAWERMFPLFKAGVGGKLGNGKQYWSWISMRDELRAIEFALNNAEISGPVNLTGPQPETNAEITRVMGAVLGRPTLLPAPAIALKIYLGEFSTEVLGSSRVLPARLEQHNFDFQDKNIESAIRAALAEPGA